MFLSVFDIFKVGIGPSSSHTMGPMTAATRFLDLLRECESDLEGVRICVTLHGSLAFTGKGHGTDRAVALGLLGWIPATFNAEQAAIQLDELKKTGILSHDHLPPLRFDPGDDIVFDYGPPLEGHPNGLIFYAIDAEGGCVLSETYYSTGGGFVSTKAELHGHQAPAIAAATDLPFPFENADAMLRMSRESGLSIAAMQFENEIRFRSAEDVLLGLANIWFVMDNCIERGLSTKGELPGGLRVRRRANDILTQLVAERTANSTQPHATYDWLSVYAMAVNEENAAGGRIVTSPTSGAAGVIPAVLRYYLDYCIGADRAKISEFLLTAAAVGGIIKHNASISGAEACCQGEVGSAAAMAAAGLCAVLGGAPDQVENAAEIALEHHLGMTCDPVGGLVQVPCIERNALGANKAVAAASLALRGDGAHIMPLDNCIEAMRQTGEEMSHKYKETSLGGLAVNLPGC
ncbi:L-serine ammonia-lyase [Nostoc sp. 3335mG]|nr:L-serine ammonia-lyase [Nostoc sp. 3335mG]